MNRNIAIRVLPAADLCRIGEIDRSEHVTMGYRMEGGELRAEPVDWQVPRWHAEGDGPHSVRGLVKSWQPLLEHNGLVLGALDEARLVGLAAIRYRITAAMAQLALLFVSQGYRRHGIARRLVAEVIRLAKADGATHLYVSATPSASAVGFYRSVGFEPTSVPERDLFEQEPEDIHMILLL